jgi:hypothetical protein
MPHQKKRKFSETFFGLSQDAQRTLSQARSENRYLEPESITVPFQVPDNSRNRKLTTTQVSDTQLLASASLGSRRTACSHRYYPRSAQVGPHHLWASPGSQSLLTG